MALAEPVARAILDQFGTPRLRYAPSWIDPSPKQSLFLCLNALDVFYGGAAGPGKSTAIMLAALQYVDVPGYAALLLRRTYGDLSLPNGWMDMARDWLGETDARWSATTKTWTFPSTATLTFGHLEHEEQKRRYAGAEFQFIGFDELTTFTETQFTFLFSRLRRPAKSRGLSPDGVGLADVPLRMRTASNPGGDGHEWVKQRFIDPETRDGGAVFIPARLVENPHLDQAAYEESLNLLTAAERDRLLAGDWDATDDGGMFNPDQWPVLERRPELVLPAEGVRGEEGYRAEARLQRVRVWDLAGSAPTPDYPDPDWSVGMLFERNPRSGQCYVVDVVRVRVVDAEMEEIVRATARLDGKIPVVIEQEPGSAGKGLVSRYSRLVLRGLASSVHPDRPTGDKATRARGVAAAAGRGEVSVVRAPWLYDLRSEARRFPNVKHDDQVDCMSMGFEHVGRYSSTASVGVSRGRIPPRAGR